MARSARRRTTDPKHKDIVLRNVKFRDLQDSACGLGADRVLHDRYISYLEFRYDKTDNPCFVWDAISCSFDRAVNEYVIGAVDSAKNFWALNPEEQVDLRVRAETHVRRLRLPFPAWCMSYVVKASSSISIASDRLDLSTRPTDYQSADYRRSVAEWAVAPSLTNQQAAERFAGMFEFTRRGWNAFEERQRERFALNLEQMFRDKVSAGMSSNQAYAAVTEDLQLADERRIRRGIARGRQLIRELEDFLQGSVKTSP